MFSYSTGALDDFEQSLVVRQDDRMVVVVGCSHPGVGRILKAASRFGHVDTLIGGFTRVQQLSTDRKSGLRFAQPIAHSISWKSNSAFLTNTWRVVQEAYYCFKLLSQLRKLLSHHFCHSRPF